MKQASATKFPAASDDDVPRLTQSAVRARIGKQRVNIMIDAPIVEHFKALAGDRGDQAETARAPVVPAPAIP